MRDLDDTTRPGRSAGGSVAAASAHHAYGRAVAMIATGAGFIAAAAGTIDLSGAGPAG
jgi:hypothetical protein